MLRVSPASVLPDRTAGVVIAVGIGSTWNEALAELEPRKLASPRYSAPIE
jgi:hypothetical protein